jgi:hypothetical protein
MLSILTYEGHSHFKYIPVGEKAELNLGPVENVIVEPVLMKYELKITLFLKMAISADGMRFRPLPSKLKTQGIFLSSLKFTEIFLLLHGI